MSVKTLLESLARLPVGALVLAGLALVVLAVLAPFVSPAWSLPLAAGAIATWLVAVAAFVARQTLRYAGPDPKTEAAIPAAVPLALGLVAAVVAAQGLAAVPSGTGRIAAEDVAGATAGATASSSALPIQSASLEPTPVPSLPPGPSLSPLPTLPVPSPTAVAIHRGRVTIQSVVITSPVSAGDTAQVTVATNAWVECTIRVGYPGASSSSGLDPAVAGASGTASWTWTVASDAPSGRWPVRVTCASGKYSAWYTVTLAIR